MLQKSDFLQDLVELAPDAMLLVDEAGRIVYANTQVSTLFGYERQRIVGQNVEILLPERFRSRHGEHRRRFAANSRIRPMGAGLELYGRKLDGGEFPVEISLSPLSGGLIAAAIRDVTDRKRVERELIAAREAADDAREEADRANLAKSRFLATASHDLRQPLQSLAMLNGALRRQARGAPLAEVIAQQEQAIGAMTRLLNALLDISKLESGAIKPQLIDCSLATLFDELRNEFANVAAAKGLELRVGAPALSAHTDGALLEQVLRNLVANAIKYTRRGTVELRATAEGIGVRIDVVDTGVGIGPDHLPFICDEFFQVGVPTNATRDGYGLGLAIVQRIVKLLGVGLDVKSQVGNGSTFSLLLPLGSGELSRAHAAPAPHSDGIRPDTTGRVLLVEDEPGVRLATQLLLRMEGYAVTTASSRAEAQEHAANDQFDVLITDYHLSGSETGLDVIADVRSRSHRDLPAILVTGDTSSAVRKLPHDLRLRLASKPIDADELLAMLRELLQEPARTSHEAAARR
jgi:two-component system, sensor histidine kinase